MIESNTPPLSLAESARTVRDFYNDDVSGVVPFADLVYEGHYLKANKPLAIKLYRRALHDNIPMEAAKRDNVVKRIIDYFLQRECYSAAGPYLKMLDSQGLAEFGNLYYSNGALPQAICCFEAFVDSRDPAKDRNGELEIRALLVRYFSGVKSYSREAKYACTSGGEAIAGVLEKLEPEYCAELGDYCYKCGKYPAAKMCYKAFCASSAIRELDPECHYSMRLLHVCCKTEDFDAAAEVFLKIPVHLLTEEALYLGIAAMRAARGYDDRIITYCWNIARQLPDTPRLPLYASLLEEAALEAEDYPKALEWARISRNDENLSDLEETVLNLRKSRTAACWGAFCCAAALLLLPIGLRIPAWKDLGVVGTLILLVAAVSDFAIFIAGAKLLTKKRKELGIKDAAGFGWAIIWLLMLQSGILINSNLGQAGRVLCCIEGIAGLGILLWLFGKRRYPFCCFRHFFSGMKPIMAGVFALVAGIVLALSTSMPVAFWLWMPIFLLVVKLLGPRSTHK